MTNSKKKILIMEDEKPMAQALELKFNHVGFEAKSVGDGEEGLAFLEKEKVDLVLLDLMMPNIDGFAVLKTLKERGDKTPVIVLSNLSQEKDEKISKELGAKEFYVKSNTPIADIVRRVKVLLE